MHATRTITTVAAIVAATLAGLLVPAAPPAGAAGVTTPAWMATTAIDQVDVPALQALLRAHRGQVHSGAQFPDGGYIPGNTHGEEAHWSRFTDAYADQILARTDCGDITRPDGPCAPEIAHLMGVIAHGTGDEVWDWLFEPNSPDLDEYYLPEELSLFQDGGGQELVMDLVAVGVHGQGDETLPPLPSKAHLLAAFDAAGLDGVTPAMLDLGQEYLRIVPQVERDWAREHLRHVLAEMPWMSHNMVDAPGGVRYAAEAVAGQWESMWGHLLGDRPPTEVSATYPDDGQRRIPSSGWVRTYQPGSHPGRGGARTRISASLTYSLPYVPAGGGPPVPAELPAGAMTLTAVAGETPVPLMAGYPRAVPYGPDAGEHTVDLQPAADLAPCTWYRVDVTAALLDADGEPVIPASWEFRTGADGAGRRCPDDPYTAEENHIRAAYQDLLGREAEPAGLEAWIHRMDRGLAPGRFSSSLVGSIEHRRRLVRQVYEAYLGRAPDPAGLAFWTEQLRTRSLTRIRSLVLGSDELYRQAGGTDEAFVERLYELLVGRAPEPDGIAYWTRWLDGRSRPDLAAAFLRTPEVAGARVRDVYQSLLHRAPDPGGLAHWTRTVIARDERSMVAAIVASPEYVRRAQTP